MVNSVTRRRGFFIDKIKGRYISKAEIITASMCNEDWHGCGSKLFLDYNFNTAICDHSSVQASSSSYPQIKVTVTYFWYFRIICSQILSLILIVLGLWSSNFVIVGVSYYHILFLIKSKTHWITFRFLSLFIFHFF